MSAYSLLRGRIVFSNYLLSLMLTDRITLSSGNATDAANAAENGRFAQWQQAESQKGCREDGLSHSKVARWRELAVDFTQNTTLHGIRYVFQETPYLLRR